MTSSVNVKYNYATNYRDYISYAINITINEKIVKKLWKKLCKNYDVEIINYDYKTHNPKCFRIEKDGKGELFLFQKIIMILPC